MTHDYKTYVPSTVLYGVVAIMEIVGAAYFLIIEKYFPAVVATLIVYVAVDNFFCGKRTTVAGASVKTHFAIPPFFKRNPAHPIRDRGIPRSLRSLGRIYENCKFS